MQPADSRSRSFTVTGWCRVTLQAASLLRPEATLLHRNAACAESCVRTVTFPASQTICAPPAPAKPAQSVNAMPRRRAVSDQNDLLIATAYLSPARAALMQVS